MEVFKYFVTLLALRQWTRGFLKHFVQMKIMLLIYSVFVSEVQNKNFQHVSSMINIYTVMLCTKQGCNQVSVGILHTCYFSRTVHFSVIQDNFRDLMKRDNTRSCDFLKGPFTLLISTSLVTFNQATRHNFQLKNSFLL